MNKLPSFDILLVESCEIFRASILKILGTRNHRVTVCNELNKAVYHLRHTHFHAVILDTDNNLDNVMHIRKIINQEYPGVIIVLTTESDVDDFIDLAIASDVGNILRKPIKRDELLVLIDKLVTKENVFGLQHYLSGDYHITNLGVNNSRDVQYVVDLICNYARTQEFEQLDINRIKLSIQEVLVNALYHSHGFSKEKKERQPVRLPPGQYVHVQYGKDKSLLGISITDFNGVLSRKHILKALGRVIDRDKKLMLYQKNPEAISDLETLELLEDGGRGIDLFRKASGEYLINIEPGKRTEIILIFDKDYEKDYSMSSIKIVEV